MAITEIKDTDKLIDSVSVLNNNFNSLDNDKANSSDVYTKTEIDDGYLKLSGGTVNGHIYTSAGEGQPTDATIICRSNTTKGTIPTVDTWHTMSIAKDSSNGSANETRYGQVETAVRADGRVYTMLTAHKNEAESTDSATISVGFDANGDIFTFAPTPATNDNSTKIATTAYVQSNLENYFSNKSEGLEIYPQSTTANHGGYIDFHFNDSNSDYTSRIIERESGVITIEGNLKTKETLEVKAYGNSWIQGLKTPSIWCPTSSSANCIISGKTKNGRIGYSLYPDSDDKLRFIYGTDANVASGTNIINIATWDGPTNTFTSNNIVASSSLKVGSTNVSLAGHTHSEYLTSLGTFSNKANGYMLFSNGLQICWGSLANGGTMTFGKAFTTVYSITCGIKWSSATLEYYPWFTYNTTSMTVKSYTNATFFYIAIGK